MKKHGERLTELCFKLINCGLEDFSIREIFELLLLFSDRSADFSDIEYFIGKYDSYSDLLSDDTVAIMSDGNENIALTGLIKLINETVDFFINNNNREEQGMNGDVKERKTSDFRKRTYLFCENHSDERIQKVIERLAVMNYDSGSEIFKAAYLDSNNRILWIDDIARGDFGEVNIDISKLFKKALSKGVKGILVAHNHSDGNLTPSVSDNRFTDRLKKVCDDMDIKFVDHIIVHGGKYHSIYRNKDEYSRLPAQGSELWKKLNPNSHKNGKGTESAGFYSAYKIAGANADDIPKDFDPAEETFLPYYDSNGDFDGIEDYCSDDFGAELIDFDDD